jgi:hypothetical protein
MRRADAKSRDTPQKKAILRLLGELLFVAAV